MPIARAHLRFKLRTLLLSVAMFALLLAHATSVLVPWYRELRVTVAMKQDGAQVYTEPRGQYLFRQFAGDALSQRAIYVHLDGPHVTDEWLSRLQGMKYIEVLSIKSRHVTDAGLIHLRSLANLRTLNLVDTKVSESGVRTLRKALPELQRVESRNSK